MEEEKGKEKLSLKDWLTEADRKFYFGNIMNSLKDYREVYKLQYDTTLVDYLTGARYLESEELSDDENPKIVRGISGYEALELWLFKDVAYVDDENRLSKEIQKEKDIITDLFKRKDNGENVDSQLEDESKKQAKLNIELSNVNIDNTFFRREKIYEKVDLALTTILKQFDNPDLKEISRQIEEHIKDRSGYMIDELELKKNLKVALATDDLEKAKEIRLELDARRQTRRRDMLTLGTCTVVKTNQ